MKGDWYFDGYEGRQRIGADGRARRELVYTGEYYGFARGQKPLTVKIICTAATLVYFVLYILAALSPAAIGRVIYVGMPLMLSMVPGVYLLIGLVCFWPAGREMTARVCFSSLRRMDRALRVMLPLAGICLAGCIVCAVRMPDTWREAGERLYYLWAAGACAAVVFEFIYLRKNPVIIVRDPDPDSSRNAELEEKKRRKKLKFRS